MTGLAGTPFAHLSEGQKQRVFVARALVSRPHMLVLDEPTAAMDALAEKEVFQLLARLGSTRRLGIVVVSHHMEHALEVATHALFVDRDDSICVAGPKMDVVRDPEFVLRYGSVCRICGDRAQKEGGPHA